MKPSELEYFDLPTQQEPIVIRDSWWIETLTHPYINRLRLVKQTGNTSIAFEGTSHSRYEHSASVGFLVSKFLPEKIDHGLRAKAIFSGLCHDIGHGPYSHSFEKFILPKIGVSNWKHEAMSELLTERLYEDLSEPPFDAKDFKSIFGNGGRNFNTEIFYLIANKASGFDMDRFDYLRRDSFYTKVQLPLNFDRLKYGVCWVNDFNGKDYSLCFEEAVIPDLAAMLKYRFKLFDTVYLNPQTIGMDLLTSDLLVECEPILNLREKVQSIDSFITLTDDIVPSLFTHKDLSKRASMLVQRIQEQDIYDFIGSWIILNTGKEKLTKQQINELEATLEKQIKASLDHVAHPDELEVQFFLINGLQDCHPEKILVKTSNGKIDYLPDTGLDSSCFDPVRKHFVMIYSKTLGKAESIAAEMAKFAGQMSHILASVN